MMQNYPQELAHIKNLLRQNPEGMSITDIAKALRKNKNTTGRYLDILLISGQVDMRTYGMAKVFTLSQRVPLSAMLSYSKDLIMVLDKESRIVDINDNFLKLLHLTKKDALGKNLTYLKSPGADVHELVNSLITTPSEERERTLSFQIKETGERIFKQKSIPTVFDDGARGVTIILSDVTEEILRERELRDREERFRMMAENIQDGLLILENGRNTFVNNRFAEITGYSFEELWAMDPLTIIAPEDRHVMEPILELRNSPHQGLFNFQARLRRKDGVYRRVYSRITSLQHENILYQFVIMTDVTVLELKDAALFESEQRFRMMAENIQDGLMIIENERFVYSNRRLSEISGYSMEELRTMNTRDLITPKELQKMTDLLKRSMTCTGPPATFQSWILCKDGEKRCIYGHINSVRHGETVSTYITMTDVTAFALREQALTGRIRELERSVTKISDINKNITHP
ncbi:MAG: PAS domain-containing protein [Methanoregula sp.]|jgi:PAS domain S-box-containing protein|uniref:PAS domain-containing protein n=1 Tax=Methanoregula sp. TaxID=2052170 RepID=UPI003C1359E1